MKLKDCKVGYKITVYLTPGLDIIYGDEQECKQLAGAPNVGLAALLIKADPLDNYDPFYCAIQKNPADLYPSYMGTMLGNIILYNLIMEAGGAPKDYHCCGWLRHDTYFTMGTAASVVVVPGGMNCASRFCRELNIYAQPNQLDGTYLCRSCRSRPVSMR